MLFSYDYGWWQIWRWQTNAAPPLAILMATAVRRGNTDGIAWCNMSRAISEATGHRHQATNCSVLPQRLPGQQANTQQSTNTPTLLAVLMAMVMRRYVTASIAWQRRSRASLKTTGRCHRASIMSNNIKGTWLRRFYLMFSSSKMYKRSRVDAKAPVFNRGMIYQTRGKGLTKVSVWFIGGV